MISQLKVILIKSKIGSTYRIRATLVGIGLSRCNKSVLRKDSPELRGMIEKVKHLVRVEEML